MKGLSRTYRRMTAAAIAITGITVIAVTAGCVKIKMEPESKDRQTEVAVNQGKDVQVQFVSIFRTATTAQKLAMTKTFIDSVSANYLRFGARIVEHWREVNAMQSRPATDAEVRDMVAKGSEAQQPLMSAYENTLEYAMQVIDTLQGVDRRVVEAMDRYREQFYTVYSTAFFPSGTIQEFEDKLFRVRQDTEHLSGEVVALLETYH